MGGKYLATAMLPVCPCFNEEFDVAEGELPEMKLRSGFAPLSV